MKLNGALSVSPFLLASTVAARSAVLFAPHPYSNGVPLDNRLSSQEELKPSDAASVLVQRAGFSQHYSLQGADRYTLVAINAFGIAQPFFEEDGSSSNPSLTIVVDGVENPETFIDRSNSRSITIKDPPPSSSTKELVQGLNFFNNFKPAESCYSDSPTALVDCIRQWLSEEARRGRPNIVFHSRTLLTSAKKLGAQSETYKKTSKSLSDQLTRLLGEAPNPDYELTILLTPLKEPLSMSFSLWGSRALKWLDIDAITSSLSRRQEPVADDQDATPVQQGAEQASSAQQQPSRVSVGPAQKSKLANSTAPRGILPYCYASESGCNERTHSCSGHGSCKKKYTVKEGDNEQTCWACACEPEKKGGKTTLWAGPACQKKDVSEPFWLLAGASVILITALSWGLGTLYSMGSEELPGVLSAGVGGPTARK